MSAIITLINRPGQDLQTSVWIGCIACHNSGTSTGKWCDGRDAADITSEALHSAAGHPCQANHEELDPTVDHWVASPRSLLLRPGNFGSALAPEYPFLHWPVISGSPDVRPITMRFMATRASITTAEQRF